MLLSRYLGIMKLKGDEQNCITFSVAASILWVNKLTELFRLTLVLCATILAVQGLVIWDDQVHAFASILASCVQSGDLLTTQPSQPTEWVTWRQQRRSRQLIGRWLRLLDLLSDGCD